MGFSIERLTERVYLVLAVLGERFLKLIGHVLPEHLEVLVPVCPGLLMPANMNLALQSNASTDCPTNSPNTAPYSE